MTMRKTFDYAIHEVAPYINWAYFYHAWQIGKPQKECGILRSDAEDLMEEWEGDNRTHAVVMVDEACSEGDDIIIGGVRLPMLRQQLPDNRDGLCLCLADFIRPRTTGKTDRMGVFAATVDMSMETAYHEDPYRRMLAQTLADRLAEATAEVVHQYVRREMWGYAADERLTIAQLHAEQFQGIRPAVGYPSLPDVSLNFLLDRLLDMGSIGIRLTEHGAMRPHASVSGLMMAHPKARYFNLGKIGDDQVEDYARRRGIPTTLMRQFLATSI